MKLLDWMQHKFRQTNNDPPTEFAPRNSCSYLPGHPSLDHDLQYHPKSHYYAKASSRPHREGQFRKSFTCIDTAKTTTAEEEEQEEESAAVFSELFHGFLAIGTLAAETVTNEPKTPTFTTYIENDSVVIEPESTENKNDEFKKVLEPERKENVALVCPLQDYLFGSVVELSETVTVKKEKEHRTSLGELFQITKSSKPVEEVTGAKTNKTEKIKEKETEKSAVCLMKKILKGKTTHHSSSKNSTTDKKPRKILQMFHRKVHPEGAVVGPKSNLKLVTQGKFVEEYKNRNQMLSEDVKVLPMVDGFKKGANCNISNMPSGCCMTGSDGYRECWINSDAEYLVLEL